ncbi:sigma-70 family RNA polymerase sigma factor [Gemella sp. zg-570]|uniref:RNA polymerase sigma factor n=2 Tax=unclassified Gemella TaxID=2624949 RepID=UPI001C0BE3B9|nr:sigma-70 family RNA polymerase sigma factor [Gemella sp. zg-570]QWQ38678.1 sigma-70 family RNA polymerase sigma factor [Gemella sp. zg-570]
MVNKNYIGKKTPQNKRTTYKYYVTEKTEKGEWKTKVVCEIKPDGTEETEILIDTLHKMDDAEIYNNIKNKRKILNNKEKAEKNKWEKEHPDKEWDFNYTQSLDAIEEKGIQLDKTSILAVSDNIELDENVEKLKDAMQKLTPKQRELIQKVFYDEIPQVEIARQENVSPSAIHNRLQKIFKAIRKNFE